MPSIKERWGAWVDKQLIELDELEVTPRVVPGERHYPERGTTVMDEGKLLEMALYVARESAGFLLREHGTVLPFGLTLDSQGNNVRTYFPRDQRPNAEWNELIDATVDHLTRCIGSTDVGVIALATELESEGQAGLGVQAETRSASLFLVYPYSGSGRSKKLGEPLQAEGLLVGPLLAGMTS